MAVLAIAKGGHDAVRALVLSGQRDDPWTIPPFEAIPLSP